MKRTLELFILGGVIGLVACDGATPVAPAAPPDSSTVLTPRIAFVTNRDGYTRIYVASEDGSSVAPLVDGDAPAWSRDGTRLAFDEGGSIYIVDFHGKNRRLLAPGSNPTWGPGDREIAYEGDGGILAIAADGSTGPRMLISDDIVLPPPPPPFAGDSTLPGWSTSPVWSPDGTRFVVRHFYQVDPGEGAGPGNAYLVNADGSDAQVLGGSCAINVGLPCPVYGADWSPDGSTVAVATFEYDSGMDEVLPVLATVYASGWEHVVFRAIATSQYQLSAVGRPRWSPDGSRLLFEGFPSFDVLEERILVLSLDSGLVHQMIPDAVKPVLADYGDWDPVWRHLPGDP
jgi:Tol biopolymer transport system component